MDFPVFHLDFFGNRMLIGVIAVLHVLINHAMAVGAIPLIATMEWWGSRTGDRRWDQLAYRLLFVCFVVTTSVGALTGVGIWLSASLVNPAAIGTLIRVFFWGWFTEWVIFVTEVSLILAYFLTWKKWGAANKRLHILMGYALAIFSWLTMAIIVAILGFMMDIGEWADRPSLLNGVLNPIYGPQLLFRTPAAMVAAGFFGLFLAYFFTQRGEFRRRAVRFVSLWSLAWSPICLIGALVYWDAVPDWMMANVPVALATQAFEQWHDRISWLIGAAAMASVLVALWGLIKPRYLPRAALLIPFVLTIGLLSAFERVREFVRKPYAVSDYMYSNGLRAEDYPIYAAEGLLTHATYTPVRTVTDENRIAAGEQVFLLACTRCHTTGGVNSVTDKLDRLFGADPWDQQVVSTYLRNMHNTRPFMPPLPGSDIEREALTAYLLSLQRANRPLPGAQSVGAKAAPPSTPRPEPGNQASNNRGTKRPSGFPTFLRISVVSAIRFL